MHHNLVFINQISEEQFEEQKDAFTKEQLEKLYQSKEYKRAKREKGKAIENWNWQAHESKFGAESDISSEYDIIS